LKSSNMKTDYINPNNINNLHELFKARVQRTPDKVAYQFYDNELGEWCPVSWSECNQRVNQIKNSLQMEMLQAGDRVAILSSNSLTWILFEQACLACGFIVVPLYADDRAENICYIVNDAEINLLLLEKESHWKILQPHKNELKRLKRIISVEPVRSHNTDRPIISYKDWLNNCNSLHARHDGQASKDDIASIVYTSGTTGKPKGVMLSHNNIMQNAWSGVNSIAIYPEDHFLSFLPLSHMLERTVGYYIPMLSGASVSFSRSITDLAEDLISQNPSVIISVPRIFERVYAKVEQTLSAKPAIVRTLFHYAINTSWEHFRYTQGKRNWKPSFLLHNLFEKLFYTKIKSKFGSRYRFAISGGAPLDFTIAKFFISMGIYIAQGYGLTETSPVISVNRLEDNDPDSVGEALPGIQIKTTDKQELVTRSAMLMSGYWKNEHATTEIIDQEGWLHTGDKAEIRNNKIYITGRLKDIIVLSNGEKIPPVAIEQAILKDTVFENVIIIGEQRPFLSALVVPSESVRDKYRNNLQDLEVLLHQRIKLKMKDFPGYANINRIAICETLWTIDNGMLTPTLKPRKQFIIDSHFDLIEKLYKGH